MRSFVFGTMCVVVLCGAAVLHAAPLAQGTQIGVDVGPTPTTNWNNFSANATIPAGSVVSLAGTTVDGVTISTANGQFYNTDGTDNWVGRSTNGGAAPPEFVESVITDIAGNFSLGDATPFTITVGGLNTGLQYRVVAVTTAPASGQIDTVTLTGATTYGPSPLLRSTSNAGSFHTFPNVQPTAGGVLTIGLTDTSTGTNPIVNAVLITAIPEPATFGLLGTCSLGLLVRRRRTRSM